MRPVSSSPSAKRGCEIPGLFRPGLSRSGRAGERESQDASDRRSHRDHVVGVQGRVRLDPESTTQRRSVDPSVLRHVTGRLETLAASWAEVHPSEEVRLRSLRLLRVHSLRTADAFQLAAVLTVVAPSVTSFPFLCGDMRLAEAAEKEGFVVL